MQTKILFTLLLLAVNLQLLAQTQSLQKSIVGTWKMVSQSVKDIDGSSFKSDVSKVSQYKIITPSHWMYVYYDTDSLKGGGDGGTYELKGNKYIEALTDNLKTDFTLRVEGNKLMQDGDIILSDGKRMTFNEVYERIPEPKGKNADIVGVWEPQSSYRLVDGKKIPDTGMSELHITTPSHYMWVAKKNGKFDGAMFGTYTREGNKIIPVPTIASFPVGQGEKIELMVTDIKPDQYFHRGKITFPDGKVEEWGATYKRAGKAKLAKAVSK